MIDVKISELRAHKFAAAERSRETDGRAYEPHRNECFSICQFMADFKSIFSSYIPVVRCITSNERMKYFFFILTATVFHLQLGRSSEHGIIPTGFAPLFFYNNKYIHNQPNKGPSFYLGYFLASLIASY